MNLRDYEAAAGDVDNEGFGPIFIERGRTDVLRGRAGLRGRVYEITDLEVLDPSLDDIAVKTLVERVYLVHFTADYYRDKADHVTLTWKTGQTMTFPYPAR